MGLTVMLDTVRGGGLFKINIIMKRYCVVFSVYLRPGSHTVQTNNCLYTFTCRSRTQGPFGLKQLPLQTETMKVQV